MVRTRKPPLPNRRRFSSGGDPPATAGNTLAAPWSAKSQETAEAQSQYGASQGSGTESPIIDLTTYETRDDEMDDDDDGEDVDYVVARRRAKHVSRVSFASSDDSLPVSVQETPSSHAPRSAISTKARMVMNDSHRSKTPPASNVHPPAKVMEAGQAMTSSSVSETSFHPSEPPASSIASSRATSPAGMGDKPSSSPTTGRSLYQRALRRRQRQARPPNAGTVLPQEDDDRLDESYLLSNEPDATEYKMTGRGQDLLDLDDEHDGAEGEDYDDDEDVATTLAINGIDPPNEQIPKRYANAIPIVLDDEEEYDPSDMQLVQNQSPLWSYLSPDEGEDDDDDVYILPMHTDPISFATSISNVVNTATLAARNASDSAVAALKTMEKRATARKVFEEAMARRKQLVEVQQDSTKDGPDDSANADSSLNVIDGELDTHVISPPGKGQDEHGDDQPSSRNRDPDGFYKPITHYHYLPTAITSALSSPAVQNMKIGGKAEGLSKDTVPHGRHSETSDFPLDEFEYDIMQTTISAPQMTNNNDKASKSGDILDDTDDDAFLSNIGLGGLVHYDLVDTLECLTDEMEQDYETILHDQEHIDSTPLDSSDEDHTYRAKRVSFGSAEAEDASTQEVFKLNSGIADPAKSLTSDEEQANGYTGYTPAEVRQKGNTVTIDNLMEVERTTVLSSVILAEGRGREDNARGRSQYIVDDKKDVFVIENSSEKAGDKRTDIKEDKSSLRAVERDEINFLFETKPATRYAGRREGEGGQPLAMGVSTSKDDPITISRSDIYSSETNSVDSVKILHTVPPEKQRNQATKPARQVDFGLFSRDTWPEERSRRASSRCEDGEPTVLSFDASGNFSYDNEVEVLCETKPSEDLNGDKLQIEPVRFKIANDTGRFRDSPQPWKSTYLRSASSNSQGQVQPTPESGTNLESALNERNTVKPEMEERSTDDVEALPPPAASEQPCQPLTEELIKKEKEEDVELLCEAGPSLDSADELKNLPEGEHSQSPDAIIIRAPSLPVDHAEEHKENFDKASETRDTTVEGTKPAKEADQHFDKYAISNQEQRNESEAKDVTRLENQAAATEMPKLPSKQDVGKKYLMSPSPSLDDSFFTPRSTTSTRIRQAVSFPININLLEIEEEMYHQEVTADYDDTQANEHEAKSIEKVEQNDRSMSTVPSYDTFFSRGQFLSREHNQDVFLHAESDTNQSFTLKTVPSSHEYAGERTCDDGEQQALDVGEIGNSRSGEPENLLCGVSDNDPRILAEIVSHDSFFLKTRIFRENQDIAVNPSRSLPPGKGIIKDSEAQRQEHQKGETEVSESEYRKMFASFEETLSKVASLLQLPTDEGEQVDPVFAVGITNDGNCGANSVGAVTDPSVDFFGSEESNGHVHAGVKNVLRRSGQSAAGQDDLGHQTRIIDIPVSPRQTIFSGTSVIVPPRTPSSKASGPLPNHLEGREHAGEDLFRVMLQDSASTRLVKLGHPTSNEGHGGSIQGEGIAGELKRPEVSNIASLRIVSDQSSQVAARMNSVAVAIRASNGAAQSSVNDSEGESQMNFAETSESSACSNEEDASKFASKSSHDKLTCWPSDNIPQQTSASKPKSSQRSRVSSRHQGATLQREIREGAQAGNTLDGTECFQLFPDNYEEFFADDNGQVQQRDKGLKVHDLEQRSKQVRLKLDEFRNVVMSDGKIEASALSLQQSISDIIDGKGEETLRLTSQYSRDLAISESDTSSSSIHSMKKKAQSKEVRDEKRRAAYEKYRETSREAVTPSFVGSTSEATTNVSEEATHISSHSASDSKHSIEYSVSSESELDDVEHDGYEDNMVSRLFDKTCAWLDREDIFCLFQPRPSLLAKVKNSPNDNSNIQGRRNKHAREPINAVIQAQVDRVATTSAAKALFTRLEESRRERLKNKGPRSKKMKDTSSVATPNKDEYSKQEGSQTPSESGSRLVKKQISIYARPRKEFDDKLSAVSVNRSVVAFPGADAEETKIIEATPATDDIIEATPATNVGGSSVTSFQRKLQDRLESIRRERRGFEDWDENLIPTPRAAGSRRNEGESKDEQHRADDSVRPKSPTPVDLESELYRLEMIRRQRQRVERQDSQVINLEEIYSCEEFFEREAWTKKHEDSLSKRDTLETTHQVKAVDVEAGRQADDVKGREDDTSSKRLEIQTLESLDTVARPAPNVGTVDQVHAQTEEGTSSPPEAEATLPSNAGPPLSHELSCIEQPPPHAGGLDDATTATSVMSPASGRPPVATTFSAIESYVGGLDGDSYYSHSINSPQKGVKPRRPTLGGPESRRNKSPRRRSSKSERHNMGTIQTMNSEGTSQSPSHEPQSPTSPQSSQSRRSSRSSEQSPKIRNESRKRSSRRRRRQGVNSRDDTDKSSSRPDDHYELRAAESAAMRQVAELLGYHDFNDMRPTKSNEREDTAQSALPPSFSLSTESGQLAPLTAQQEEKWAEVAASLNEEERVAALELAEKLRRRAATLQRRKKVRERRLQHLEEMAAATGSVPMSSMDKSQS